MYLINGTLRVLTNPNLQMNRTAEARKIAKYVACVKSEFFKNKAEVDLAKRCEINRLMSYKYSMQNHAEYVCQLEWNYTRSMWSLVEKSLDLLSKENVNLERVHGLIKSKSGQESLKLPEGDSQNNGSSVSKKTSMAFCSRTVAILMTFFDSNRYPSTAQKRKLAAETQLTSSQVTSWFSNKRTRQKQVKKNQFSD